MTSTPDIADIVERITDGFFALDSNWLYTYLNKKAGELLHLDPTTIIGEPIWAGPHYNADHPFYKACLRAMALQEYECVEARSQPDNSWTEYHVYPSHNGCSILFRDITQRKEAEEELKRTELQFSALIEQASDSIMITDMQGNFLEVNSTLCKLFGYTREELLRSNIRNLLDPEELKTSPIQFELLATGQPVLRDRRMVHKDGTIIEVESNVKLISDGRLLAIARDITERKKAAQQIVKEKQISETIIDSLPGIFMIREINGKILRWNQRLETVSGYSAEEIPNLKELHFIEDKDKELVRQRVQDLVEKGQSQSETIGITKDGRRIPFYLTGRAIELDGKTCILIIGIDISERKMAEDQLQQTYQQLRHLSSHLQDVREEERKGIAREIHDELGQQLTALSMDLAWALKKCKEEKIRDRLSSMNQLLDNTIVTVRRISSELRPSILDDLGLADALDWQSVEFEKRYRIKTRLQCQLDEQEISSNITTGLFRIYQESLTNVARHANATTVRTSLRVVNDELELRVTDDGKGFDPQTAGRNGTFGLIGIKERAQMMGGKCSIFSSQGSGTSITISVPLNLHH